MRHVRTRRLALLVSTATVFAVFAGTSSAKPIVNERFHDEGTFVEPDFCGAGLTVNGSFVVDGRIHVAERGQAGLVYFLEHVTVSNTLTANGITIRDHSRIITKDLKVTDNGDGTLTIIFFQT